MLDARRKAIAVSAPLWLLLQLSGCTFGQFATAETTGIVVGGTAGAATGNPFIGLGAGLLSSWGMKTGFEHYRLNQQAKIQRVIAHVAGDTALGQLASWTEGRLSGQLEVTRVFGESLRCKEVVYTVRWRERLAHHVGTVCKSEDRWEWAVPDARAKPWIEEARPPPSQELPEWE